MTTITLQETGFKKDPYNEQFAYFDHWLAKQDVPVYEGYYVEDLRTLALGRWDERGCDAAFLQLAGQQGVIAVYITELAPGASTPPYRMALDECVYVLSGRGITTVEGIGDGSARSFEWQTHSMFRIPAHHPFRFSNVQGGQPARLMHSNYLPLALSVLNQPEFFLNNPSAKPPKPAAPLNGDLYSEAKAVQKYAPGGAIGRIAETWVGNFFPDMRAWDKLSDHRARGAGGSVVFVEFMDSPITAHMSVFPPKSYKKAHRHGPGFVIVIPAGEGYSIMWKDEQSEKIVIPWHEASCFVPPFRWFHQHFNISDRPDRYLAIHPPRGVAGSGERIEDRARDQIEYVDEDPWIRQKFEEELAKRGFTSVMPDQVYRDPNYAWELAELG